MDIRIYWLGGDYTRIDAPPMSFADGYLVDYTALLLEDWETEGIRIERVFYGLPEEDPDGDGMLVREPMCIVRSAEFVKVGRIVVDGTTLFERNADNELKFYGFFEAEDLDAD